MRSMLLVAVNAKYIHSNLAVYSLRAYARAYLTTPADIRIGEYTINQPVGEILADIYRVRPDVLCFSCYIWNVSYVEELAEEYHKLCPQVPIWAGGPEVSYETETFLRHHPAFTGVMVGEGEQTFLELCEYYIGQTEEHSTCAMQETHIKHGPSGHEPHSVSEHESDGLEEHEPHSVSEREPHDLEEHESYSFGEHEPHSLSEIGGLVYHNKTTNRILSGMKDAPHDSENGYVLTAERPPLDMDTLPFCYDDLNEFRNRILYYESSRGCPFRCSYCLSSVEKCLRFRSTELVERELAYFLENEVAQVKFVDRTFNCYPGHALAIWRYIQSHDNGITNFHFEIAADLLTDEMLDLLDTMRPGLVQLEIGVQSTNEATIAEIHRTMRLARVKEVTRRLLAAGRIHIHLDLIAGLPYEDYDTFTRSFDEIYALKPSQLQLGFLKILKGSYMYEHAEEYGLIYRTRPPYEVLRTNWLSYDDILRIRQAEEMLEVYYNSGQYEISIKILETQYESPFDLYRQLGAFYETQGYDIMSHTRTRRAEILLEFSQKYSDIEDILKEALIFDLYYRENCKNRPPWAPDPFEWRELTRRICGRDRRLHVERFHYRFPQKGERALDTLPVRQEQPLYVTFDYSHRDPLDHQASWAYTETAIWQPGQPGCR